MAVLVIHTPDATVCVKSKSLYTQFLKIVVILISPVAPLYFVPNIPICPQSLPVIKIIVCPFASIILVGVLGCTAMSGSLLNLNVPPRSPGS